MAQGHYWQCSSCDNEITISGYWEFFRDKDGNFKHYGHPAPISEEAKKSGVKGFYVKRYCPKCREIKNSVIIEFDDSAINENHWKRLFDDDLNRFIPKCDKCGSILKENLDNSDTCPKCNKGVFTKGDFWIC